MIDLPALRLPSIAPADNITPEAVAANALAAPTRLKKWGRTTKTQRARDAPDVDKNHGSFSGPAREQLQQLVDKGFARLYRSRAEAEEALGGQVLPRPPGRRC